MNTKAANGMSEGLEFVKTDGTGITRKVVWEHIGEGYGGDFQENDPEDTPLFRFSCYQQKGAEWEEMTDASYCTLMPVPSPEAHLRRAAELIMGAIEACDYKRRLEELSWLQPSDFQEANK